MVALPNVARNPSSAASRATTPSASRVGTPAGSAVGAPSGGEGNSLGGALDASAPAPPGVTFSPSTRVPDTSEADATAQDAGAVVAAPAAEVGDDASTVVEEELEEPQLPYVAPAPAVLPRPLAFITGATSGIGLQVACELLRRNQHDLILCCREDNPGAADAARALFKAAVSGREAQEEGVPPPVCSFLPLELSQLPSVADCASACATLCAERGQTINLVILCAGAGDLASPDVLGATPVMAPGGWEHTFSVNFIGHAALIRHFLDQQPSCLAQGARVTAVSCGRHTHAWRVDPENWDFCRPGRPWWAKPPWVNPFRRGDAYNNAKAVLTTWALRLDAVYGPSGRLSATVVDPGLVPGTRLLRAAGSTHDFAWQHMGSPLAAFVNKVVTPAEAAADILNGAANVAAFPVGGVYFHGATPSKAAKQCYDAGLQAALWSASPEMMGGAQWPKP